MHALGVAGITVGIVCVLVVLLRIATDPARLRNGGWLLLGCVCLWFGTAIALQPLLPAIAVPMFAGVVWGLVASAVIAPAAAIINGIVVLRREGPGIAAALPVLAGLLCLVAAWYIWSFGIGYPNIDNSGNDGGTPHVLSLLALSVLVVCAYVGLLFITYAAYSALYLCLPEPTDVAATVTLGAAVPGGVMTPLLAGRLDKAISVRRNASDESSVVMVVSGGRGPDEPVSEADAMARYLREQGIDEHDIRREDRSTTTKENLQFSHDLLTETGTVNGAVVVVTNSFHALRAASLARELGLPWRVVGSRTARYYLPTAFLREFGAILLRHWRIHLPIVTVLALLPVSAIALVSIG